MQPRHPIAGRTQAARRWLAVPAVLAAMCSTAVVTATGAHASDRITTHFADGLSVSVDNATPLAANPYPGERFTLDAQVTNRDAHSGIQLVVTDATGRAFACPASRLMVGQSATCTAEYAVTLQDLLNGSTTRTVTGYGKDLKMSGAEVLSQVTRATPFTVTTAYNATAAGAKQVLDYAESNLLRRVPPNRQIDAVVHFDSARTFYGVALTDRARQDPGEQSAAINVLRQAAYIETLIA